MRFAVAARKPSASGESLGLNFYGTAKAVPLQKPCPTKHGYCCELDRPGLQRNIPVLLRRVLVALAVEHLQRLDQAPPRLARRDHRVYVSSLGSDVRIGKELAEFFNL